MNVLGIDIGQQGAAAVLSPDRRLLDVVDLPTLPDGPSYRPTISAPPRLTAHHGAHYETLSDLIGVAGTLREAGQPYPGRNNGTLEPA